MASFKEGVSSKGRNLHYAVGAIIKNKEKYLLIDRSFFPKGFACISGHVEDGESDEDALFREVEEESGFIVNDFNLIGEGELIDNLCNKKAKDHYWKVYSCKVSGNLKKNGESKSIGWYSKEEIKNLNLEPSWGYWLKKLGII